jgi:ABC-type protease/lipase transport system fused ATPase/permease subunit
VRVVPASCCVFLRLANSFLPQVRLAFCSYSLHVLMLDGRFQSKSWMEISQALHQAQLVVTVNLDSLVLICSFLVSSNLNALVFIRFVTVDYLYYCFVLNYYLGLILIVRFHLLLVMLIQRRGICSLAIFLLDSVNFDLL